MLHLEPFPVAGNHFKSHLKLEQYVKMKKGGDQSTHITIDAITAVLNSRMLIINRTELIETSF